MQTSVIAVLLLTSRLDEADYHELLSLLGSLLYSIKRGRDEDDCHELFVTLKNFH